MFLRNAQRGFVFLGLAVIVLLILALLFLFYFKNFISSPPAGVNATLPEYSINTSNYKAMEDSVRDKIQNVENERLEKMKQLEQDLLK